MVSKDENEEELFHAIHKVPAGDSPYVRAKHVQLIEKDPSRAISLFWTAINAGDRVDSALKDMAVVMKQLDRSDEAIEAIKSFRHLCPDYSQESLDNILLELYKRSKRIEEEIKLLHCKLKITEEVIAFGGKYTKIARSQGKKTQITLVQELSRILGNLAWAYLQQNDYESAEQYYMKALSLEPDKNKQCNLAICLMRLNRIAEAKSLLQAVKASSGNEQMDESFAKSFERASRMLTDINSQTMLQPIDNEEDKCSEILSFYYINQVQDNDSRFMRSRMWKKPYSEIPCDNSSGATPTSKGIEESTTKKTYAYPSGVVMNSLSLFTQSRRSPWIIKNKQQRKQRGRQDAVGCTNWKLPVKQMPAAENMQEDVVMFTQPRSSWIFGNSQKRRGRWRDYAFAGSVCKLTFENTTTSENMEAHAFQNIKALTNRK